MSQPTLDDIEQRLILKLAARCAIGWIDYSSGSWDMCLVRARAYRIVERRHGRRISLRHALFN